ncbi:sensor histidine kinase [Natrinema caseinilyticum]|uniref:sensor histidine kinase n=1 Tax=Natrinema caseinilyticum TaxID=2961570 RepID=UPI0020C356D1|nr:PAS domain-containing sensor histidine kinase [Natrinema caseinilyticum]
MKPANDNTVVTNTNGIDETNVVLSALLKNLPAGVLVEDSTREIIAVDPTLCDILAMDSEPSELVGRDCAQVAEELRETLANPARFRSRIETILDRREPVFDEEVRLADGRTLERTYTPYTLPRGEANLWLYRDVTEWKNTERRLQGKNETLEEFISVVSHDLRNPLNVATANLELAREVSDSDRLDEVADALDRMGLLIEDLLVLARKGHAIGVTEPINVGEVARECWSHVETAPATLSVDADRTVRADRSRLSQVFENLFRNAVEHGGQDVTITVGTVTDGFYVEDDGRGIRAAQRDRIFDGTYSTSRDGTGLGLQIVETIVTAHGWEIDLADPSDGGTRFVITDVLFLD